MKVHAIVIKRNPMEPMVKGNLVFFSLSKLPMYNKKIRLYHYNSQAMSKSKNVKHGQRYVVCMYVCILFGELS